MRSRTTLESVTRSTRKESLAAPTTSAGSNSERLSSAADDEKLPVRSLRQPLLASLPQLPLASPLLSQLYARPLQLPVRLHNRQPLPESRSLPRASSATVVVE